MLSCKQKISTFKKNSVQKQMTSHIVYFRSIRESPFPQTPFFHYCYDFLNRKNNRIHLKITKGGDVQDGRGVKCRDHLPPHKYIRNTSTCGTTPTEHLLNAGRRPQTSQKARHSPRTWVGQKKKEKNREKRIGTGSAPLEGSCEGGKVSKH